MSSEMRNARSRLIAGVIILIVLLVLAVSSLFVFLRQGNDAPQVNHRRPAATLAYCAAQPDRLCVVSFIQEEDGQMQVNFLTGDSDYPALVLKISDASQEATYECEEEQDNPQGVVCRGPMQEPGQVLQFRVFAKRQGTLLAEGRFAIIGIALATPVNISTETPTPTATATSTETPMPLPTAVSTSTPTGTPATPSYPNPSYP